MGWSEGAPGEYVLKTTGAIASGDAAVDHHFFVRRIFKADVTDALGTQVRS